MSPPIAGGNDIPFFIYHIKWNQKPPGGNHPGIKNYKQE